MIRLLIYNWIPFDEDGLKGGGVTVYTRSLISCLCKNPEYEVSFLSSGRAYNRERADVYIEKTSNVFGYNCNSYQIVNSPVLSPAVLSFPYTHFYIYDYELKCVLREFLEEEQFDIIHFQNLEGLSLGVFELREEFPSVRFVYSAHNYFPICPQVMLWEQDEKCCVHDDSGLHCLNCMNTDVFIRKVIVNQEINYEKAKGNISSDERLNEQKYIAELYCGKNFMEMQSKKSEEYLGAVFKEFRKNNIAYINKYFDKVLAVSERVLDIFLKAGVNKDKIQVSYIGTQIAEKQYGKLRNEYKGEIFHLCYLGFMRKMKGFYFILDALDRMPDEMAKRISFTFATEISDDSVCARVEKMKHKFAEIKVIGKYNHNELPEILSDTHLGIVPPLWEDNLPQVAIEFKANGVPVLCSDLGGAKELSGSDMFVFQAGNIDDFIKKVCYLLDNPDLLSEYWSGTSRLMTMSEHVKEITQIYATLV